LQNYKLIGFILIFINLCNYLENPFLLIFNINEIFNISTTYSPRNFGQA